MKNLKRSVLGRWAMRGFFCLVMACGLRAYGETGLAAAATQAATAASQPAVTRPFMWKITSPTTTAYLLGLLHVGTPDLYPLQAVVEKAFTDAAILVVEVDITNIDKAKIAEMVRDEGMYKDGDSLDKHLSKAAMDTLKTFCTNHGFPLEAVKKMKPWCLDLVVETMEMQELGLDQSLGIDKHFLDKSKDKKVVELETMAGQFKLLSGFGDKLGERTLTKLLKDEDKVLAELKTLVAAWKAGDEKAMAALIAKGYGEDADGKLVMTKMLDERNPKMAEKIEGLLQGDKPLFVVVGAGHLVGKTGLLNLLAEKGLKVEQAKAGGAGASAAH